MLKALLLFIPALLLASCSLFEKEIEVKLPAYEKELALEAYMEPGKPFRLTLSETVSYYDSINPPTVNNATIYLFRNGDSAALYFHPYLDVATNKAYNYYLPGTVTFNERDNYQIKVRDQQGRSLAGSTSFTSIPQFDSVYATGRTADTLKGLNIYINDDAATDDYYRVIVNQESIKNASAHDQLITDQSLEAMVAGNSIPVFTPYKFRTGDTLIVRLYHLKKDYYDFLLSANSAKQANGNPFAQPAELKSNVTGGIGIFTGISYIQRTLIIR